MRAVLTRDGSVQANVGEGPFVKRHIALQNNHHKMYINRLIWAQFFSALPDLSDFALTSNHSVAPTLPYSPALQLANTRLLLGLKPSKNTQNCTRDAYLQINTLPSPI